MKSKMIIIILSVLLMSCSSSKDVEFSRKYVVTSPEVAEIISLIDGMENHIVQLHQ